MIRVGTCHFVSLTKAVHYYTECGFQDPVAYVRTALKDGSIHIGPPKARRNERITIIDDGTRYAIVEDDR